MISSETRQALEAIQDSENVDEARLMLILQGYILQGYTVRREGSVRNILHVNIAGVHYSPSQYTISLHAFVAYGQIKKVLRCRS